MHEVGGSTTEFLGRVRKVKLNFWKVAFLVLAAFVCFKGFTINHKMEIVVTHKTESWSAPELKILER